MTRYSTKQSIISCTGMMYSKYEIFYRKYPRPVEIMGCIIFFIFFEQNTELKCHMLNCKLILDTLD